MTSSNPDPDKDGIIEQGGVDNPRGTLSSERRALSSPYPRSTPEPLEAAVAACHLSSSPAEAMALERQESDLLFNDEDLRVRTFDCACGLAYVHAWRRIPRSSRTYLIPALKAEVAELVSLTSEPRDYVFLGLTISDRYNVANAAVARLAKSRAYIELTNPDQEPWVPQWAAASTPFAFLWAPF